MKEKYEEAEIELVKFNSKDILTTSVTTGDDEFDPEDLE